MKNPDTQFDVLQMLATGTSAAGTLTPPEASSSQPPQPPVVLVPEPAPPKQKFSLDDLLDPRVISKLKAACNSQDLMSKPLGEVLADLAVQSIVGPWQTMTVDGRDLLAATYSFAKHHRAHCFVSLLFDQCYRHVPHHLVVNYTKESTDVSLHLGTQEGDRAVTDADISIANYCNYVYNKIETEYQDEWDYGYFRDYLKKSQALSENNEQSSDVRSGSQDDQSLPAKTSEQVEEKAAAAAKNNLEASPVPDKQEPVVDNQLTNNDQLSMPAVQTPSDQQKQAFAEWVSNEVERFTFPIQVLNDEVGQPRRVRIPATKLGEWKHPLYKKVEFTDGDFNDMIRNFGENVLGFEPPLFLGHALDEVTTGTDQLTYRTAEGAPAEGFLDRIYAEDGVLFTEFEIVNEQVYDAVKAGRYRYASGEFVRNYANKADGKSVGTVLVGMALTNRPFIPQLPRVTALTEASGVSNNCTDERLTSLLYLEVAPTAADDRPASSQPEQNVLSESTSFVSTPSPVMTTPSNQPTETNVLSDLQSQVSKYAEELNAVKSAYQQQLSDAMTQIETLNNRLAASEAEKAAKLQQDQLAKIDALTLPADVKQRYSDLVTEGKLGASVDDVIGTLVQMSQMFSNNVLQQHGETTTTEQLNDPDAENPYKHVIEQNVKLATAKRVALAEASQANRSQSI